MSHIKTLLILLTVVLFVTACGAPAVGVIHLQGPGGISGANPVTASPTATQAATEAGMAASAPDSSGLLTELPASADPAKGDKIFHTFNPISGMACATCHRADSEETLVGPGLLNVGRRAETRVQGLTAVAYIDQSIINPSAYVVNGFPDIMPKNWAKALTQDQIEDVIAYLLTLK